MNPQQNTDKVFEKRVTELLDKKVTTVTIQDNDNEAWESGWAGYLLDNFARTNINLAFRANLEKPKLNLPDETDFLGKTIK